MLFALSLLPPMILPPISVSRKEPEPKPKLELELGSVLVLVLVLALVLVLSLTLEFVLEIATEVVAEEAKMSQNYGVEEM
jgi:hypothetical protein